MTNEEIIAEMRRWWEDFRTSGEVPDLITHMREWLASQESGASPPHDPANLTKYPRNWR